MPGVATVEHAFASMVERLVDGIAVVGRDGVVRYANAAAEWMLAPEGGELVGREFGYPVITGERTDIDLPRRSGIAEMRVAALVWDGEPGQLVALRDVTEHRGLARDLERRVAVCTSELRVANESLEEFASSVAHELRAPLRAIDGYSQLLLERCGERLDETASLYLHRSREAVQRMGALIDDLLALTDVGRAGRTLDLVDLTALAREIGAELAAAEPGRTVELVVEEDLVARGDPKLLRVMLANLFGNAWKFTRARADARVDVGQARGDPRSFFVCDNGTGFDPTKAELIFEAFRSPAAHSGDQGAGVGLAIARKIVRRHGGEIWAESEPGAGATFTFTLPDSVEHGDDGPR